MKSLAYIVSSVMTDIGVADEKHYVRFLKWAIDGFRKMNLHGLMPTIKTVELDVDKTLNVANLPEDYIEYVKVGICVNGVWINFDLNNNICNTGEAKCPCEPTVIENTIYDTSGIYLDYNNTWEFYNSHVNNGIFTAGYYGVGAGFNGGGYKIDLDNGRIIFDSYVNASKVVLEYRSTGIADDGSARVDEGAIEALTAYVNYQRCTFSKDPMDIRLISHFKSVFEMASMSYNMRNNARTPHYWMQLMRSDIHQAVKR